MVIVLGRIEIVLVLAKVIVTEIIVLVLARVKATVIRLAIVL